jgi:hypothetical protein
MVGKILAVLLKVMVAIAPTFKKADSKHSVKEMKEMIVAIF